jgi:threonine dehydrogenase-like Zn-dependent dehydrogenase
MSVASDDAAFALWTTGPGRAEIRPAAAPVPGPGDLRLRALVSGISRGTESLVFHGDVPDSEWQRMRCPFQEGEFPFPVKYGYAMVARVEDGPAELIGERAFCLYPHQTRFTLPIAAARILPPGIPSERAALAAQMETALNATWDAAAGIGERIAVVGAGAIGCLVAYLCARLPGAEVTLIDRDAGRRPVAAALGVGFATTDESLPADCDLVFHASGEAEGLALALSLAGFEGKVIELSWYGSKAVALGLGGAFHSRRLTIAASQVGSVAPSRRARWDHARRLDLALALTADPRLDVLVRAETPFDQLPAALPEILGQPILGRPGALLHLIRYP